VAKILALLSFPAGGEIYGASSKESKEVNFYSNKTQYKD
jgi:hypothetical protein